MNYRLKALVSLLALCTSGSSASAASLLLPHQIKDMVILGQSTSQSLHTRQVSMQGNYVYASGNPGLQTVDVSDASNMIFIDDYGGTSAQPNASNIKNNILYLANWDPGTGLKLFNLTNPAHPALMQTISTSMHSWECEIVGNLMYLTIGNETNSGVITYDITNPTPVLLHTLTIGDRLMSNIARFGNYMYFTHKNQLRVYDVTTTTNPQFVRTINRNTLFGNLQVRGNYLYVLGREITAGEDGGMWVFSLANASNPQEVDHWDSFEPRDMHFMGNYCIVPCSGGGIHTLNVTDPNNIFSVTNWGVSWPNSGSHGGYPINVTGSGRFIYIGTTSGNFGLSCEDFSCPHFGGRLYSVQIFSEPPIIANVTPDPQTIIAARPYSKQLTLIEGGTPLTWSVVQGPSGIQIDQNGFVDGWAPSFANVGQTITLEMKALNSDGNDTETWNVFVDFPDIDFDNDSDCDQSDFGKLQRCISGPGIPSDGGCSDTDVDGDADVDATDFTLFLPCMNGANHPPGC